MNTQFERAGNKDEWLTPRPVVEALGAFDLDPCAPVVRPWATARHHLTIADDGLSQDWQGRAFVNPPYRALAKWIAKLCRHGNGVALTFARTETNTFFDSVWNDADAVLFIKGRLSFFEFVCATCGQRESQHKGRHDHAFKSAAPKVECDRAGAPSVLIAYGTANADALASCGIEGKFVPLIVTFALNGGAFARTWRELVRHLMRECGGRATLGQLYDLARANPKAEANRNWKAKIRQQVQRIGIRVGQGEWKAIINTP